VITTSSEVVSASVPVNGEAPEPDPAASYRGLTVKDLRDLARDRGLPVTGSKDELVGRHAEYDRQP